MIIQVKVHPQAKMEKIEKRDEFFEIWVKEKPIKGQANQAVINVLVDYFKCSRQDIKLIRGFKQRKKIFELPEVQGENK